jgi:hypothetical protein
MELCPFVFTLLSWLMGSVSVGSDGMLSEYNRKDKYVWLRDADNDTYSDFLDHGSVQVVPHRLQLQCLIRLLPMPSPCQPDLLNRLRQLLLLPVHDSAQSYVFQRPLRLPGGIRRVQHVFCSCTTPYYHGGRCICRVPLRGQAPNSVLL